MNSLIFIISNPNKSLILNWTHSIFHSFSINRYSLIPCSPLCKLINKISAHLSNPNPNSTSNPSLSFLFNSILFLALPSSSLLIHGCSPPPSSSLECSLISIRHHQASIVSSSDEFAFHFMFHLFQASF